MAHIWKSFKSRGVSSQTSAFPLESWRPKAMSHCSRNGLASVQRGM